MIQRFLSDYLCHRLRRWKGDEILSVDIPMSRIQDYRKIRYISAIALKLAAVKSDTSVDIAKEILDSGINDENITTAILPSGMIQFDITAVGVANWLHKMTQIPWQKNQGGNYSNDLDSSLFIVQYYHARCCSLLRIAHGDRLITLADPEPKLTPCLWISVNPKVFPWLDDYGQLRLIHDAEQILISELINLVDLVDFPPAKVDWEKVAMAITEKVDRFFRQCQIWGEVKLNHCQLCQARLGLVIVTQSILQFLLQEKLGIIAPLEL